nr:MAG TPA: hypothetical protein [Caudoviricetes sp.]
MCATVEPYREYQRLLKTTQIAANLGCAAKILRVII